MSKDTNPENSPQEEFSIGDLLRSEREKKGISKSSLAESIKVRENVIDALENEEWDKLPARVFIKGFIRSYTISIGYDTKKALRLFDKSVPTRGEDSPVPLTGSKKKSWAMYYVVPVLIVMVIAVYLFAVRDKADNDIELDQAVSETPSTPTEADPGISTPEQIELIETSIPDEVKETISSEPENKASTLEKTPRGPENASEEIAKENKPAQEVVSQGNAMGEALQSSEEIYEKIAETTPVEDIIPDETIMVEEDPGPETVSDDPPAPVMTLSATVNLRTYVRMIVDDNPPKEYIFQPGKIPQWTAERGFEVKVGNAAGIEFEFNGEKIENIGAMGKVKTLRFPEDFRTNWEE